MNMRKLVVTGLSLSLALGAIGYGISQALAAEEAPKRAVSTLVLPSATASPFLTEANFVTNWLVLGPFTFAERDFGGGHQQAAADKEFMPNEGELDGTQEAPKGTKWQERQFREGAQAGAVDLDALYGGIDHAAAYAVAWLDCPEDLTDAKMLVGSDDYIKVWINGKLVHTYKTERRGSDWDQDSVRGIELKKGLNRVVVKCVDVVGGWDFYLRFTTAKDLPITVKKQ
jgi:hypothetical protein